MTEKHVIALSLPASLRVPGQQVAGLLDLNVHLAQEKHVEKVNLSLKGILTTWITVANGDTTTKHTMKQAMFPDQTIVIWQTGMSLPPYASGVASIPFAFTLPNMNLPPSFHGGTVNDGASIQYFIHAEGVRKQWYKFNIRVNAVFPFLSFDPSPAPGYPLPKWPYDWSTQAKVEKVRKSLFSHSGQVTAEVILPKMEAIPLFRQIPVRVRVICKSKPLPLTAGSEPSTFEFPRNPKLSDIDLNLYLHSLVRSSKTREKRKLKNDLGLQAGFGLPDKAIDRAVWGMEVASEALPPRWHIDPTNAEKGYWQEEITYSSVIVFRCPPPIVTEFLSTHLILALIVDFPGLGNKVTMDLGPLNLTTGVALPSAMQSLPAPSPAPGMSLANAEEVAPAYEPPGAQCSLELPPSYYSIVDVSDEKSEKS